MTWTDLYVNKSHCAAACLHTNQSRSYLNHLVILKEKLEMMWTAALQELIRLQRFQKSTIALNQNGQSATRDEYFGTVYCETVLSNVLLPQAVCKSQYRCTLADASFVFRLFRNLVAFYFGFCWASKMRKIHKFLMKRLTFRTDSL